MAEINSFRESAEGYVETEFTEKNGNLSTYLQPLLDSGVELTSTQWGFIDNWWDHVEPINWRDLIDWLIDVLIEWIKELLD